MSHDQIFGAHAQSCLQHHLSSPALFFGLRHPAAGVSASEKSLLESKDDGESVG